MTAYYARFAHESWKSAVAELTDPLRAHVADLGCGGGVYTTAFVGMGAAHVTGIDPSAEAVETARKRARGLRVPRVSFRRGEIESSGFPASSIDIVLMRAVLPYVESLEAAFAEAKRILRPGGTLLVQERTVDDISSPQSREHLLGWIFAHQPKLLRIASANRPCAQRVEGALRDGGFSTIESRSLAEVRRSFADASELHGDLVRRADRRILDELPDVELAELADRICAEIAAPDQPFRELDHWSLWAAQLA